MVSYERRHCQARLHLCRNTRRQQVRSPDIYEQQAIHNREWPTEKVDKCITEGQHLLTVDIFFQVTSRQEWFAVDAIAGADECGVLLGAAYQRELDDSDIRPTTAIRLDVRDKESV